MAIYIDSSGSLHHDQGQNFALVCPHCDVMSHLSPVSVPQYNQLLAFKPNHVGIVYRCDSCNAPLFLKYPVTLISANRVELGTDFEALERPRERFNYTHLPEETEQLFREALACFSAGCLNAFASMCRRTAQSAFADLGESGKLRMFDQLVEIREMGNIDTETFNALRKVIFGSDAEPRPNTPRLNDLSASVLLEVMKDLLYETYVRRGKLQQAMSMRRVGGASAAAGSDRT